MSGKSLSTGEAARLCSVNPDTVLKWIKHGRLRATRTAGGHYRIKEGDIAVLMLRQSGSEFSASDQLVSSAQPLRCWEYLGRPGAVREECRRCGVYQMRASWCFRVATNFGCELGEKKNPCAGSCDECPYYRRVVGQATNVLVITSDQEFTESLGPQESKLALRYTRNAYEASAAISSFRAVFVVVDQDLIGESQPNLIDCLCGDARIPGARIILATAKGKSGRFQASPETGVVSIIEKPFGQDRVAEVVNRFPVEQVPTADAAQCR